MIKPRYESYWQGAGHNFISCTPGFREVMERDCFIILCCFLHLVDQTDEALDKSDKIYKVMPMLDRMLPIFCRYFSPLQQLSLDEGMIPTKNRLAIKQCIHDKLCQMGHQELHVVRGQDRLHTRCRNLHRPGQGLPLASPRINQQCYLPSCGQLAGHQQEPHAVHGSFLQLCHDLPPAEERTWSPGSGHRHAKPQALPHGFTKLE